MAASDFKGRLRANTSYDDCHNNDDNNNNNNNNDNRDTSRPVKTLSEVRDCEAQERKLAKCEIPSESEDWQLLESEEKSNSTESDKMGHGSYRNSNSTPSVSKSKVYVDIQPETSNYSPPIVNLCAAVYALLPLASATCVFLFIFLLFTRYYLVTLAYVAYVILDRQTCNRGGCRIGLVYRSSFWSYLAAYFPIKLRHSVDFKLDPKENYILNYHPHGIAAFGSVTAFATNGLKFEQLFPGMTARFMVHETSFVMPVLKETFALRGDCSVNSRSIDYILSAKAKSGKAGNLLSIVVGGLSEADLSDPETLKVVVAKRKGFVKKALIHGANLIPCIAFGENSVFTKVNHRPGSFMDRLETKWYSLFKFKHPIYYGRSLLSEKLAGSMPYKRPITVVMGDPILVSRIEQPTQEDIDQLHSKYIAHLKAIYEDNADLCRHYDRKLEIV